MSNGASVLQRKSAANDELHPPRSALLRVRVNTTVRRITDEGHGRTPLQQTFSAGRLRKVNAGMTRPYPSLRPQQMIKSPDQHALAPDGRTKTANDGFVSSDGRHG
ncbi:MAG: hypothetical protein KJ069_22270 [Anaerolineae bacterium]|nr:hypothetical protein [Anaerolineae bacterium]